MINDIIHWTSAPRLTFLAWGDFHVRSRFARSVIPEEKWGLTPGLLNKQSTDYLFITTKV